jgi:hypothetical protein
MLTKNVTFQAPPAFPLPKTTWSTARSGRWLFLEAKNCKANHSKCAFFSEYNKTDLRSQYYIRPLHSVGVGLVFLLARKKTFWWYISLG